MRIGFSSAKILFRSWFNDLMFCLEGESTQEDCYSEAVGFTTDSFCILSILNVCVCVCIYVYIGKKVCSAYTAAPWNITPKMRSYSNSRIFNYKLHCCGCILHGIELTTDMSCFRISSLELLFFALFFMILYKRNQTQSYTLSFFCQCMCKSSVCV